MGKIDEFDPVIKLLADDFSYLTLDLPGHGKTQVWGEDKYYQMQSTAQGLIELLDELKIDKCFLVGYSMGGRLALYLTLHFPERFIKVILESALPGLVKEADRLNRIKSDFQIASKLTRITERKDFETFLNYWYSQPIFGNIKNHPDYKNMLESRLENNPIRLTKSLKYMGTGYQPSLWEKLKDNQIPLLLIAGEIDQKFVEINTQMLRECSVAQLKIIEKAGHNIHLEQTEKFVQIMQQFFTILC
jgi:2-succinyl-6-hydroxy-2,4-cyclohexadiene-1-carboxylate synthase